MDYSIAQFLRIMYDKHVWK